MSGRGGGGIVMIRMVSFIIMSILETWESLGALTNVMKKILLHEIFVICKENVKWMTFRN